jgi:hypothetical protein
MPRTHIGYILNVIVSDPYDMVNRPQNRQIFVLLPSITLINLASAFRITGTFHFGVYDIAVLSTATLSCQLHNKATLMVMS